jgi:hypothetical protein
MSAFTFNCPQCAQAIQCDPQWAGQLIQCPLCQAEVTVPTPPPPQKAGGRLSVVPISHADRPPVPISAAAQQRPSGMSTSSGGMSDKTKRIIKNVVVLAILLPVAWYFLWPQVKQYRAQKEAALHPPNDSTATILPINDPSNAPTATATNAAPEPIVPPEWTMNLDEAKIPRANPLGMLAGTNFQTENVFVDVRPPTTYVLSLRHGTNVYADRELFIYVRLKPGENIGAYTNRFTPAQTAGGPSITKRWKASPRSGVQQKVYSGGYAMRLEFGKRTTNDISGKIYLALPDPEQSVVAGRFTATVRMPQALPANATMPQATRPPGSY